MKISLFQMTVLTVLFFLCACGENADTDTLLQKGTQAGVTANWESAKKFSERALAQSPEDPRVMMLATFVSEGENQASGEWDTAINYARKAAQKLPEDYEAQHLLGRLLYKSQKSPFESIPVLQKAYALNPKAANNTALLAQSLMRVRRYQEAWGMLCELAKDSVYGSKYQVWNELGMAYMGLAKSAGFQSEAMYRNAAEMFERAAGLTSQPNVLLNLARVRDYYLKDTKGALGAYQRFLIAARQDPLLMDQAKTVRARYTELKLLERQTSRVVQPPPTRRTPPSARRR